MAKMNNPNDTKVVGKAPARPKVTTGKPRKVVVTSAMRSRVAFTGGGTTGGSGGNFYSPELSTDFLELPQSLDEQRNYYRFFYQTDPFVGQAIDLHTELPLSKIRLGMPKAEDRTLAQQALDFCERWSKKEGLLHRLIEIVHDYYLLGEVFIFVEDISEDMPQDIREEARRELTEDGEVTETYHEREDADEREVRWMQRNFHGWSAVRVLPPEQIHMESFPFTSEKIIELIPDSKTKDIVQKANQGDVQAQRIVNSMPRDVVEAIQEGRNIPLNTDPDAGSFVYYMSRKKSQYEPRGHSILERCIRVLVYRDKLRQAQTSIASRHMTPYRLVYAEDMDAADTEELRDQIDLCLQDPDYTIVTNFQVTWEEMGGGNTNRLLELSSEYDLTDRQMYSGLGVTESLLSGESSYSGDRINLEVINTRYMLLREILQDFVDEYIFKPMCRRMGFIEEDELLGEQIIYPKLSFTRLGLRDNSETFDALFNLYQKGSLDVDVILELLNIDPVSTRMKLERDLWSINDPMYNEMMRSVYSSAADKILENTEVVQLIAEKLGLNYEPPAEGDDRF
jgi:hypothetical protein